MHSRRAISRLFFLITMLMASAVMSPAQAQVQKLNLLTDLGTPFPPGCLSIEIPDQPRSADTLLVNQVIGVPSIDSTTQDAEVSVRIWRVACADEGLSVVLVRLQQLNGNNFVIVPQVFAEAGDVEVPFHEAQLLARPGGGNVGASGGFVSLVGETWMLGVQQASIDELTTFLPEDYNEGFSLELTWESFSPAQPVFFRFLLDRFDPTIDPPQFEQQVLNGRYSGQWRLAGKPRTGLVLQIAEQLDDNFVFAMFFTYLDGAPFWVGGNTEPSTLEPGPVTIPMAINANGEFLSVENQPPPEAIEVTPAGQITLEVVNCNELNMAYDFSPAGLGSGTLKLERLIRIAGYDCNPWQHR
ncbi:MAG: hypothetical protein RQ741_12760 [Wenzhouxiangellaceae bacterium]|nr:hypothetical protein [Wenzhouxiangellaceae bacterium]